MRGQVQPVMVKYPHQEQCVYTGSEEYVVEIPHSKSILYYSLWCELNLRKYIFILHITRGYKHFALKFDRV